MTSHPFVLAVAGCIVFGSTFPGAASAQTESWSLCSAGTFQSCASLQFTTSPIYSGLTRVGTDLTIVMHNLNGQSANDNTAWSSLTEVLLFNSRPPSGAHHESGNGPLTFAGGATGSATWGWRVGISPGFQYIDTGLLGPGFGLGGCAASSRATAYSGPLETYTTSAYTCGPGATATFSFSSLQSLDATNFDEVYFQALGQVGGSADLYEGSCRTQPDGQPAACSSFLVTPTPEPVSLTLMATGVLSIGVARLRRRKQDVFADL